MQDMTDRLARLNDPTTGTAPSDSTVAADLSRGQRALRRRTARRAGVGVVGVAAAAAVVTVAVTSGSSDHATPRAGGQHPPVASTHAQTKSHPSATHHVQQQPAIKLVAYHGTQKPGFTVQYVPDGYVLQGVSGSTLDIATADDHTPLNTFSGKLTVGAEQAINGQGLNAYHGTPVTINGEPGLVHTDKYATTVVFKQGGGSDNIVTVQCWSNIKLTQDQVVDFAKGVTVTADVQRQHG